MNPKEISFPGSFQRPLGRRPDMKFSARQVKTNVDEVLKGLGKAWDFMVPAVREAMIDQRALQMLSLRDEPGQAATADDITALQDAMYIQAGLDPRNPARLG